MKKASLFSKVVIGSAVFVGACFLYFMLKGPTNYPVYPMNGILEHTQIGKKRQ